MSAVNIAGGFLMTGRMLNMFRRPTDPPNFANLLFVPVAAAMAFYLPAVGRCRLMLSNPR
jgi:NAD(P) transhydrogenase